MTNMKLTMFEVLLELPLFQGIGKNDLTKIVETAKFDFSKYASGKTIFAQDALCDRFSFITKGQVNVITKSADNSFTLVERLNAPNMLQADVLFGLHTRYTHGYSAFTDVNMISLPKPTVITIMLKNEIFRINLLNYLSMLSQRTQKVLWMTQRGTIEQQIGQFIYRHVSYPAGEKVVSIKMEDLARELNETRMNVSKALNTLQEEGLLILRRKEIIVPAFEKLLNSL